MQMPLLAVSDHVVWGSAGGSFASYDTELALQRLDGSTRGFASEAAIGSRHNCQRNAVTCTGCSNKLGILAVVDAHLVHLLAVVHTADHLVGLAASILTENQSCHPRGIGVTPAVIAGCDLYLELTTPTEDRLRYEGDLVRVLETLGAVPSCSIVPDFGTLGAFAPNKRRR